MWGWYWSILSVHLLIECVIPVLRNYPYFLKLLTNLHAPANLKS